ncbi:GNAT family N-acetyltransferase [Sphingomonas sp.]|uniref:GNAT family N-acetyltransferase n=1 Tax=Sphingomonas sp. TaxID=28214 RepID=UPI003B3AE6B6
MQLRPQVESDVGFLRDLYISIRWDELQAVPWPEENKRAFLVDQFSRQYQHYAEHYAHADFLIIEQDGEPIGRLCVDRAHPSDMRIVDIALLPQGRGHGIGTELIRALLAEARATSKVTSIHVEDQNPAKRLYSRLGFEPVRQNGPYWLMEAREAAKVS